MSTEGECAESVWAGIENQVSAAVILEWGGVTGGCHSWASVEGGGVRLDAHFFNLWKG